MPTYRNDSDYTIFVDGNYYGKGEVFHTYKIINREGITLVSKDPIFPVAISETTVTAAAAGDELSVAIDLENCKKIVISEISAKIEIRANVSSAEGNNYKLTANAGETVTIKHDQEIETLYIKFPDAAGSCKVTQFMRE